MEASGGGGGGGGDYPPAHIRSISSGGYGAAASAPPAPEDEEDGHGRRVLLDVPLPPKGAEPRDLWAAVVFFVMTCLLATLAVRLGLPALGVWEAELNSSSSSYYSDETVAAARTVLGVSVALALAGGLLAMVGLHLMLHWSSGAFLTF